MKYKIKDICTIICGGTPSTEKREYWGSDIVWLTPKDLSVYKGKYVTDSLVHISKLGLNNSSAKIVPINTVLLSSRAPIGYLAIAKSELCTNQGIKALICNENLLNYEYLYYLLMSKVDELQSISTGSTFLELSTNTLKEYEIDVHSMSEQQHIVNILGTIDDKIENNENLVAKINESTKLFYINFCNNGFVDDVLENYIENYDRQRKPLSSRERDSLEKIYPYYGATEVLDYVDNYLFDGDYLLMGEDGTVADSLGFPIVQRVNEKFWANNHTHILKAKNGIDNNVLELILKNTNVQSIITGAVQPKINQANMNSLKIKVPNDVETLMKTIVSYFEKRQSLIDENKKLNKLKQQYLKKFFN